MCKTRSRSCGWKAAAGAAFLACAVSGCGDDGPTLPEVVDLPALFGDQLYKADGSSVGVGALAGTTLIGIYFASPGCPACGGFTPILVDAYNQLSQEGKSFEVVLVSSGISQAALLGYMVDSEMPWLAVPPGSSRIEVLVRRYNVRWIPTLVIIDDDANTISLTGREELTQAGATVYDVWLSEAGGG